MGEEDKEEEDTKDVEEDKEEEEEDKKEKRRFWEMRIRKMRRNMKGRGVCSIQVVRCWEGGS